MKYDFQTHADENKTIALFAKRVHKTRLSASARSPYIIAKYVLARFTQTKSVSSDMNV